MRMAYSSCPSRSVLCNGAFVNHNFKTALPNCFIQELPLNRFEVVSFQWAGLKGVVLQKARDSNQIYRGLRSAANFPAGATRGLTQAGGT